MKAYGIAGRAGQPYSNIGRVPYDVPFFEVVTRGTIFE